ncbi:MAG TPA: YihY/virulence factor BrkB family protein, partial [Roseiflexaceae bacterium]|nr:YihY/virulence factor BrkB family protein [Roseiflexaceae bacterium]
AGASRPAEGAIASTLGVATLLFGAIGLFGQLKDAMNTIWEVQPKSGQRFMATVRQNLFSFTMVLGTAFLLLVSLIISAVLAGVTGYVGDALPGMDWLWQALNFAVGFAVTTLVFALIFKLVPDVEVAWGDVWIGALATAVLFALGRLALGWYLGRGTFSSSYGAAASLVVVLLWVYYSAQILFLGAEFTQVYARRHGSRIQPAPNAIPVTAERRAQQGMPAPDRLGAAAELEERAVGGAERRAGALAVAVGFLVGLVTGRKQAR